MTSKKLATQPEPQAITFVRKTIQIGPVTVDGFMMPNGEFRQGLRSTGRVIGRNHQFVSKIVSRQIGAGVNGLQAKESQSISAPKGAGNENFLAAPVIKVAGRPESLLSLPMAQSVWAHEARYGEGSSQDMAWQLINTLAGVSLERSYQEAFGIEDSRNQQDRLLDYFIDLEIGPYRKLFDRHFQIHFKRVSGHDINSTSSHVKYIIANLLWNRLPSDVYETIMDLNPADEHGKRKYKHHQLLSDNAKMEVIIPIVTAAKALLMQATPGDMRFVNYELDRLYPVQRGRRKRVSENNYNQMRWV